MAEVLFRARLSREESNTPWGFRLQGGADYKKPLTLLKVVEGSIAAKNGLHHSDILVKLAGKSAEGMTHKAAQEAIIAAGNSLEIIVERAEATIYKSPPNTPTLPQKVPSKPIRIETMVFESSKLKAPPPEETISPIEIPVEVDANPNPISVAIEASENIPSNSITEEQASDTTHIETFVKDPAEFQVNRHHRPGAKRSDTDTGDDTSPELSSSESAESLDADTTDFLEAKVPEEKLLSTADDDWSAVGARSSRSPVPPGGEAWRRECPEYEDSSVPNQEMVLCEEQEMESGIGREVYSTASSTVIQEITTLEQPESRETSAENMSYPWGRQGWSDDDQLEEGIPLHIPGATRTEVNYGIEEDERSSLARGHVGGDEVSGYKEEEMVTPSLTFVGRRVAPPVPTVEETSTNQGPSPHISVTPSSPPSGLTVLPLSQLQKQHRQLTDQNILSHVPFDLSQLSQEMSDIKLEALRLMSNNAYHSPRLEDIHFSTGGPEVVDIPMPAVKEMVEDLNRRLEAIAAQQPKIAQPPTAQELGISYIKQRRKELEEEEDPEKEIFIDMPPADISIDTYGHRFLGNTDGLATNNYQKLYDASSPAQSPNYLSTFSYKDNSYQERVTSPRNQRRVHFADPPEQSVIEIESRSKRRRKKEKEKNIIENSGNEVTKPLHESLDTNKYPLPSASHAPSSVPSATDVLSYSPSTKPVMIQRPVARLENFPSSAVRLENFPSSASRLENFPSPAAARLENFPSPAVRLEDFPSSAARLDNFPSPAVRLEDFPSSAARLDFPSPAVRLEDFPSSAARLENFPSPAVRLDDFPSSAARLENFPPSAARLENYPSPAGRLENYPPSGVRRESFPPSAGRLENFPSPSARLENFPSSTSPKLDLPPYQSAMPPSQLSPLPATGHPGQFSVSITHKKSDQATPTRLAFTLPSGQPGQPTHFRYTMSGSSPGVRTPSPQLSRASDAGLTYSLPPRYEDSVRMMNQNPRSFDDYYLMQNRRTNIPTSYSPHAVSPQPMRQTSPVLIETSAGSAGSPRSSPVYTQRNPGYINPIRGTPASLEDTTQSKSFRALEAHYTDDGYDDESSRVQILGTPQQVLQPAAVGRPFSQAPEPRTFTPPPPQGAVPGPPPAGSRDFAGAAIGPGLFALFDSSFTDKFVQWQQSPRSHFESETYKLVHEMEGSNQPGSDPNY